MTEEEIIRGISSPHAATQTKAIHALYHGIGRLMRRSFMARGTSHADAADILQDTVIRIFSYGASYSGEGTARGWMWRVARNCLVDHLRRQGLHRDVVDIDAVIDELAQPDAGASSEALADCVEGGVRAFGEEHPERQTALLLHIDGASIEEIAMKIGRTPGATREFLSQCRKKLAPFLTQCREHLSS